MTRQDKAREKVFTGFFSRAMSQSRASFFFFLFVHLTLFLCPIPALFQDGIEEVQLADSFQRLMDKEGLSEEHTPQELRFQVSATLPLCPI